MASWMRLVCGICCLLSLCATAQDELAELSLEELLDLEVTSASRRAESRTEIAGAVTVLTRDDIRRSSATNIVDLLRTVPGINVAKLNASDSSVTIGPFGGVYANRLLVMIDGRSVYTPLFGGTFWQFNDIALEEIEQIEIIRGPGGAVWGANAVNGVINIITRNAADTPGGLVRGVVGNEERFLGYARYGGKAGENGHFRLRTRYTTRDEFADVDGEDPNDAWQQHRLGFRYDWKDESTAVMADAAFGSVDQSHAYFPVNSRFPWSSRVEASEDTHQGYMVLALAHDFSESSHININFNATRQKLRDLFVEELRDQVEIDMHHRISIGEHQELVWGIGYRYSADEIDNTDQLSIRPASRTDHLLTVSLQDTFHLLDDRLHITLGARAQFNDYTGFEIQPTARAAYEFNTGDFLWAAVSRAVRTPTRIEHDGRIAGFGFPRVLAVLEGNDGFESETLTAFELGYRRNIGKRGAIDIAVYHYLYDNLRTTEADFPRLDPLPLPIDIVLPLIARNNSEATATGIELATDWRVLPEWWLRFSGAMTTVNLDLNTFAIDPISRSFEHDTPRYSASVQSLWQVSKRVELDTTLRYVGELESINIDDYLELDLRIGFSVREDLLLELVGRNLLNESHEEFAPAFIPTAPGEVERSIFGRVTWTF